ncbi:MAG: hypothetical protein RLZZ553_1424 [Verrucomicrobiota bacterium]|jgi:mannose-6-phosphate isomerase
MAIVHFQPMAMERVWGGRMLESHFHRTLPNASSPFGESWEMVDRVEAQSIVTAGDYAGLSLHELWRSHREQVFGLDLPETNRFPLLIKILDACEDLSIQVHPPSRVARELNGEPKTEMWYIAAAQPGARLVVGLKSGVTAESFARSIETGTVADQIHEIPVHGGDSIFIPSGRLHAIGGGLLIFEIQQNSDTTYRVFDWNRVGLDGKPRELHIEESLASIDFTDTEPSIDSPVDSVIAHCEHFLVERFELRQGQQIGNLRQDRFSLIHLVEGELKDENDRVWPAGSTLLITVGDSELLAMGNVTLLRTNIP